MKQTLPLKLPAPSAEWSELLAHFSIMGSLLACRTYEDSIQSCLSCGQIGENLYDKQYGHARFCSKECEALMARKNALYAERNTTRVLSGERMIVGDSPSVKRRQKAKQDRPKRAGIPGGPKCGRCGNHPASRAHKVDCAGGIGLPIAATDNIVRKEGGRTAPKCPRCGEHPRSSVHRTGECK